MAETTYSRETVGVARLSSPKIHLHINGVALAAVSVVAFALTDGRWWLFAALIFAPDLSMLGYLLSPRIGAATYNAGHSLLVPAVLVTAALAGAPAVLLTIGLVWASHLGVDHMFGYGYKYATAFKDTHLGRV